jgi:hypothetical protein
MKKIIFLTLFSFTALTALFGQIQYKSKYPDIPIVDVHVHVNGTNDVANYLQIMETVKKEYASNLSYIIGLTTGRREPLAALTAAGKNRFLFATNDVSPIRSFIDTSSEIIEYVQNGFVGNKFWFGAPYRRLQEGQAGITKVDDPRLAPY